MEEFELEPGEQVILSVRKHWLVFAVRLLPYALLALVPFLIPFLFSALASAVPDPAVLAGKVPDLTSPWARFALGLWWLLLWTGAFNTFTRYYLDVWIVTTTRIVDIHQFGFFRRQVSSFLLGHIQNVTTEVNGILATLFDFGTIHVETAGQEEHFVMKGVGGPAALRDLIMREVATFHEAGTPVKNTPAS
jgi:hypothetical protein